MGVVSTFWSASDTDFKNLSSNFLHLGRTLSAAFLSTFWSASDTDLKNLSFGCLHLLIRVSQSFDQQVTPPKFHLISKWYWLQKPKFGCLCLLIRVSLPLGVSTFWSWCLCLLISKWYWLQKPKFQLSLGVVSTFWSASDTDFKNLTCPTFTGGVSTFWSASDTDFKNLISNFHWGVVSTFWSASDTDFKNLTLGVSAFQSGCLHLLISKWHWLQKPNFQISLGGCLHLLISKWHWLQKPKFGCLCLLIRVSPPFDVSTFWSVSDNDFKNLISKYHWGVVSTFWSASDTDFKNLSLGVSTFQSGCLHLLISKWQWLQKPNFQISWSRAVSTFWSASDTDFKNLGF